MEAKLSADSYYKYRKKIRELYKNDTVYNGDLCSSILKIRDKNKCVSSISVAIQDYAIDLEFDDDTPDDKKIKIKDKVANSIGRFLVDNKAEIGEANDPEFDTFLESENNLYCDIMMVGNTIKFNL